jgi:hypothetical protein
LIKNLLSVAEAVILIKNLLSVAIASFLGGIVGCIIYHLIVG